MSVHLAPDNHRHSTRSTINNGFGSEDGTETTSNGGENTQQKLFACPYLKRDPDEYGERQSCSKSGWVSVHGVRQHVYRCHILPIKCPSCSQTFVSSHLFTRHLNEAEHCDRNLLEADEPISGLESLVQKIKSPKTMAGCPTEEDMWKVLYTTLFPRDPKDEIPYPYHEQGHGTIYAMSPFGSQVSIPSAIPFIGTPRSAYFRNSQRSYFDPDMAPSSFAVSPAGGMTRSSTRPGSIMTRPASVRTRPASFVGEHSREHSRDSRDDASGAVSRAESPAPSIPRQRIYQFDAESNDGSRSDPFADTYQAPENFETPPVASSVVSDSTGPRKLKKKKGHRTVESKILEFRAWEKPHRTDEHITPGVYRGFWKWLGRCFTFYIPSWFLKKFLKMDDIRQRLAFRQKVLFCILLAVVYGLLGYFLIIQPIASCVVKVPIGMIPTDGQFCTMVRSIIYVYMGIGGAFMLLVMFCVARVRYTSNKFEERDSLLVMQMPCYNEDENTLRKTIDSCVNSSYNAKRKLLFIVADGIVGPPDSKPTYKILLEDIFNHQTDLEGGSIESQTHSYTSFDADGTSKNMAFTCTGHYQGVPYVVVVKVGRDDEQAGPRPGNRGKRDSQLVAYNFFHYVNYRRFWDPLFENIEFQMRISLNLDPREALYMLAIDCDTEVDKTGISYLVDRLEKDHKLIGACGYTGVGNPMASFITCSQIFEYWLTHAVLKALESVVCSVLVLSGCFTIYRLKWPNNRPALLHPLLLEDYAGSYEKTLHEHNLLSIGEDRYLSTLAIRYFGSDCRLKYFAAAKCTTIVPTKLSVLLDQRRRWTNSLVHCHFAHLNVLPFEASFWTLCKLLLIIGAELFMVFILPLALPAGVALAVISILLTPYAWAIMLAFLLFPVLLCILCMDWSYIPAYIPFFPMIAVFSIIIPIFSMWNQDNIKWGKTRIMTEAK